MIPVFSLLFILSLVSCIMKETGFFKKQQIITAKPQTTHSLRSYHIVVTFGSLFSPSYTGERMDFNYTGTETQSRGNALISLFWFFIKLKLPVIKMIQITFSVPYC